MPGLLVDLLLRVAGLMLAAMILTLSLRRSSASVRALVWTSALAGALLVPAVSAFAPALPLAVLPAPLAMAEPTANRAVTTSEAADSPPRASAPSPSAASIDAQSTVEAEVPRGPSYVPGPASPQSVTRLPAPQTLVLVVWSLVALLLLARLIASHLRLRALVSTAAPSGDAWTTLVRDVRRELGIRRQVRVRVSPDAQVPAIAGVMRPVLLVPLGEAWTASEKRDVVLHELAHVARWDGLSQLLSQIACAVYWFIPIAWFGARQAAALREQACDNVVLNAGTRPSVYAERLLTLARAALRPDFEPAVLAMARPTRIRDRVVGILDPSVRRTRLSGGGTSVLVALALAVTGVFAAAQPVAAKAPQVAVPDVATPQVATPQVAAAPGEGPLAAPPALEIPPTESPTAFPMIQQRASSVCKDGVNSTSTHIGSDNGDDVFRMKTSGARCEVSIEARGKITFNESFTDIARIDGRGTFDLDARMDDTRRELSLRFRNGTVERTWKVNGREQAYDAAAAAWFARFLVDLDRQTAFGVDVRLPHLLRSGGVAAVLDETAQMPSDHARTTYYKALSAARRLSTAEIAGVLDQSARLSTSDYYASELLTSIARQNLADPAVRLPVMRLIERMKSDHYRHESIKATVGAGRPSADELSLLLRVVGLMEGDYYMAETVKLLLQRADLSGEQLSEVLMATAGMESDHYVTEVLRELARRGPLTPMTRRTYLSAIGSLESDHEVSESLAALLVAGPPAAEEVPLLLSTLSTVQSDHYRGEVLNRLLTVRDLSEIDLVDIAEQARRMGSDHYKSELLRRVGRHAAVTQRVRDAVYSESAGLSTHYRDEVRRAIGQR